VKHVTFLGLGVMGYPMAGYLSEAGHRVTVFNRTTEKAERWCSQYQGRRAATASEAVKDVDAVFTCLGDDPDVREVVLAPGGVLDSMPSGSLYVDHTTASAGLARDIAAAGEARNIACLDAPVSGGQAGAENGVLTIMVGGTEEAYARAEPFLGCYGKTMRLIGPTGSGQLTKMCNQIAIAGVVQGLAEALNFGKRAGLDVEAVIEVISKGAAQSWQMENRWQTMIEDKFDFGFAVEWMRKDLRICLDEARRNGAELPIAALVDQFYADVEGMGGKRWDTSSLIARLNRQ